MTDTNEEIPPTIRFEEMLLTPRQVANRFAVDPKTVTRWARTGKLPFIRTPGGHRRYRQSVVDQLAVEAFEHFEAIENPVAAAD
jgi:excisionase family DNA binding protein